MFTCFNRPYDGTDSTVSDFLLDAFRCAKRKSKVFGSFYKFSDADFARALRDAAGKDSSQRLDFDFVGGNEDDGVSEGVKNAIKDLKGYAKLFDGDPDGIMNHNKFLVFDELDFAELKEMHPRKCVGSVPSGTARGLYLSSANLTEGDLSKHNNSILVPINSAIYDLLWAYYKDLRGEYRRISGIDSLFASNKVEDRYETAKSDCCKVYLYPRRKESDPRDFEDTLVGVLKNVEHYQQRISDKPCKIHIAVAAWYKGRMELAETLAVLSAHGADVKVISRKPGSNNDGIYMEQEIRHALEGRAEVYFQRVGRNIHSKYMLIDGPYRSGHTFTPQKLVWMGSPNYSGAAVWNHWEIICKLYEQSGAYDEYLADFYDLIKSGTAVHDT